MKFSIHDDNLQLVWDCLNNGYNEVWLHGSGDVFPLFNPAIHKQDESKIQSEYFNRGFEQCSYRVLINKANMPKTVKEAITMLQNAKLGNEAEKEKEIGNTPNRVTNVRRSDTDFRNDIKEPAGEIDYSKFNKSKNAQD